MPWHMQSTIWPVSTNERSGTKVAPHTPRHSPRHDLCPPTERVEIIVCLSEWGDALLVSLLQVYKTYEKGIPQVNFIEREKVFPNLRTFTRVMTHLEPSKQYSLSSGHLHLDNTCREQHLSIRELHNMYRTSSRSKHQLLLTLDIPTIIIFGIKLWNPLSASCICGQVCIKRTEYMWTAIFVNGVHIN